MEFTLRLYVSGHTPNSVRAISAIKRLLDAEYQGMYSLDIIDVLKKPQMAYEDGILVTPTLLRLMPLPVKRVIGDLSSPEKVRHGLQMPAISFDGVRNNRVHQKA
ncbi:MAG TPA: circadian clock protein KaiB [Dehalococcoidia bacterium]|jgi:circadian clock protein KaiB|nr:circadian clock protein KaiB [Dehalococcoidia bacterium]